MVTGMIHPMLLTNSIIMISMVILIILARAVI